MKRQMNNTYDLVDRTANRSIMEAGSLWPHVWNTVLWVFFWRVQNLLFAILPSWCFLLTKSTLPLPLRKRIHTKMPFNYVQENCNTCSNFPFESNQLDCLHFFFWLQAILFEVHSILLDHCCSRKWTSLKGTI